MGIGNRYLDVLIKELGALKYPLYAFPHLHAEDIGITLNLAAAELSGSTVNTKLLKEVIKYEFEEIIVPHKDLFNS